MSNIQLFRKRHMSDYDWILHRQEGQFFERKSCFDRSQGKIRRRVIKGIRISNS